MDPAGSVDEAVPDNSCGTSRTSVGEFGCHGSVALDASTTHKRTHQRSITAVRVADLTRPEGPLESIEEQQPTYPISIQDEPVAFADEKVQVHAVNEADMSKVQPAAEAPFPNADDHAGSHMKSGSSSESNSTIPELSNGQREGRPSLKTTVEGLPSADLDVMSYLESDSPAATEVLNRSCQREWVDQSLNLPLSISPSSQSSTLSHSKSLYSEKLSESPGHETDRSTSPEQSPTYRGFRIKPPPAWNRRHRSYGTPEMARGNTSLPHISPKVLASQVAGYTSGHIKPLPRAEKLPLTGYEQLASQLSYQGSGQPGPHLKPIYRRFATLNHRLLLHLQDELCELEEQLHRLDTADTQTRRLQNGIFPASRRAEALSGGELQWHKTDILGKIGFKLEQYNRVLASFEGTASLSGPAMADVHQYRDYLATYVPIIDTETHFLDQLEDLICLEGSSEADSCDEDMAATPMPRRGSILSGLQSHDESAEVQSPEPLTSSYTSLGMSPSRAAVFIIIVFVSTLILSTIPGYLQRMSVVVLFTMAMAMAAVMAGILSQSQAIGYGAIWDLNMCVAAYGIIMAVVAAVC